MGKHWQDWLALANQAAGLIDHKCQSFELAQAFVAFQLASQSQQENMPLGIHEKHN